MENIPDNNDLNEAKMNLGRKGRFLKKGSQAYKCCQIEEYDFEKISVVKIAYPDNLKQNIIHQRFHEDNSLDDTVHEHATIHDYLIEAKHRPPVIPPTDFTAEWLEEKKKAKRRSSRRYEDEDEFEMALEEGDDKLEDDDTIAFAGQVEAEKEIEGGNPSDHQETGEQAQSEVVQASEPQSDEGSQLQDDGLKQLQNASLDQSKHLNPLGFQNSPAQNTEESTFEESGEDDFLPNQVKIIPDNQSSESDLDLADDVGVNSNPEEAEQPAAAAPNPDQQQIDEQALQAQYERGLAEGIEKAQEHTQEKLQLVEQLHQELKGKKKEILTQVQAQFENVVSALTEAIIGKEIAKDSQQFVSLIEKAVNQTVKDEDFKIHLSEESYSQIPSEAWGALSSQVNVDPELKGDQFRIESENSLLESDINQIVKDLMSSADLNLFEPSEDE